MEAVEMSVRATSPDLLACDVDIAATVRKMRGQVFSVKRARHPLRCSLPLKAHLP